MIKILSVTLILCSTCAHAQLSADTLFVQAAVKNNIKLYTKSIQGQTALYNGSQYKKPNQTGEQHPFFGSEDWVYGRVTYDKLKYDSVPLLYDITSDKVITENYYNGTEIMLVYEKLNQFEISGHNFIKLHHRSLPKNGFYELVYDGPTMVVARRQKIIRERIVTQSVNIDFDPKSRYFIYKNSSYFPVSGKASALKILEDEKAALKQFISKNKISFKPSPEAALKELAKQYDLLKKRP